MIVKGAGSEEDRPGQTEGGDWDGQGGGEGDRPQSPDDDIQEDGHQWRIPDLSSVLEVIKAANISGDEWTMNGVVSVMSGEPDHDESLKRNNSCCDDWGMLHAHLEKLPFPWSNIKQQYCRGV